MASELKPWRYEIKYGPDGEDSYSWVYDDQGVMVAPMRTHKAKEVVDRMNTRPAPAATDTGLVTIGYVLQCNQRPFVDGEGADYNEIFRTAREPENWTATVTRSQAEAIIAANAQTIEGQRRWIAALEADNAALTARVKELETERDEALDDAKFAERIAIKREIDANASVEALEAKLAAAEKALEPFADHANDRAVDDTCWREKETVKIVVSIGDLRKARAVLGGKPS